MADNFGMILFNDSGDEIFNTGDTEGGILIADRITINTTQTGSKRITSVTGADVNKLHAMALPRGNFWYVNKVTISGNLVSWATAKEGGSTSQLVDIVVTLS